MSSPCANCGADLRVCIECDWYNGEWISEDEYEARLKADMVAMLTEIQLEINASAYNYDNGVYACYRIIQQKINKLKENENGNK